MEAQDGHERGRPRARDLEEEDDPAGPEDAPVLAEAGVEIGQMAEGVPHAQEVEALVREGQRFPDPLHQVAAPPLPRLAEHARARVQPDDVACRAHQVLRALCRQP